MSKLEKLINQLCPDGVEYKALEEIAMYRRGSFPQPYGNSEWYGGEGEMPFIQVADMKDDEFNLVDVTKQTISVKAQPKSVFVPKGTVLVSLQGTIGRVAITQYDSYVDRTIGIFTNFLCDINTKYFAYQLATKFNYEKQYARGSTLKTITKEEFSKFTIPLPPLPIQEEIVRILDNMTSLTAELTAELKARQKQYEYYRDSLLSFEEGNVHEGVRWMKLGEVLKISRGIRVVKAELSNTGYPVYQNSLAPLGYFDRYNCDANKTFVISAGAAGEVGFCNTAFWAADDCYYFNCAECGMSERYLYFVLLSQQHNLLKMVRKASIPRLGRIAIENLIIPVPSLEEQQRIVDILDRFDKLCNDISEGLPAEIEARKKQYEYYRDKLLTFKEKEA